MMWFGMLLFFSTIFGNPPPPSCLSLFPKTSFTSLHVYSPEVDDPLPTPFMGRPLPPSAYAKAYRGHPEEFEGYYAISQFRISRAYNGYIVRGPSQYQSSEIMLFVISRFSKKTVDAIILADSFGDEMWFFETNSWLSFEDGMLKVVTIRLDVSAEPDDPDQGDKVEASVRCFKDGRFITVPCDPRALVSKYHLQYHQDSIGDETKYVTAP